MHILQPNDLIDKIEEIKEIMVEVATGGPRIQDKERAYKLLHRETALGIEAYNRSGVLIENPNHFRSLWDWYGYWSSNLSSYQARRDYVRNLYEDTLEKLTLQLMDNVYPSKQMLSNSQGFPLEIQESLRKFQSDYSDSRTAFIMMKFSRTKAHTEVTKAIRHTLGKFEIQAVRADDKQYHDDLFPNILTYIHGCEFGIAVFERIEADEFNPNVSLELGYMLALGKPVCLLKDKTLKTLHTDLVGKLYHIFDLQDIADTINHDLSKWLLDKGLIDLKEIKIRRILEAIKETKTKQGVVAFVGEITVEMNEQGDTLQAYIKLKNPPSGWALVDGDYSRKVWEVTTESDLVSLAEELIVLNKRLFNKDIAVTDIAAW